MSAKILGIQVSGYTMRESLQFIFEAIAQGKQLFIITANAEIIMLAQKDRDFYEIITGNADLVLPDGAGVVLAAKHLGQHIPERVAGYDLVQEILPEAAKRNLKIFLFGAAPTVAQKAADNARTRFANIDIVGIRDGFFKPEQEAAIIEQINDSGADIVFFALGVPKQEKFIAKYRQMLRPRLLIGVGGTFDVMAGNVKRAPLIMQKYHLEWLYRLLSQPSRAMRMLVLPKFVFKVLCSKGLDKRADI